MMNPFSASLMQAAKEYFFFTQGYPQKASLKLVGDKFMLAGEMRQAPIHSQDSPADRARW